MTMKCIATNKSQACIRCGKTYKGELAFEMADGIMCISDCGSPTGEWMRLMRSKAISGLSYVPAMRMKKPEATESSAGKTPAKRVDGLVDVMSGKLEEAVNKIGSKK